MQHCERHRKLRKHQMLWCSTSLILVNQFFLDLHLLFHIAFAKSALCIYWCLLPTNTKSILNYVTISIIWSSVSCI